jgi:hypothetical protein
MTRVRRQSGWALVTAVMVIMLMLAIGLATFSFVDAEIRSSTGERQRESAFNYAEALLNQVSFMLASHWPGTAARPYPDCSYSGSGQPAASGGADATAYCPSVSNLSQTFAGKDYAAGATWTAKLRDNLGTDACDGGGGSSCSYFYDDASELTQPAWDSNGDGEVWVRVQVVLHGDRRTLIARVHVSHYALNFPHGVLSAGNFEITNSPKATVNTGGAGFDVRCAQGDPGCVYLKGGAGEVAGGPITYGWPARSALSADGLAALRQRAIAEGAYYATCPTSQPPGPLVFVEQGDCTRDILPPTSQANPGLVVIVNGTLTLSGGQGNIGTWYGLIYLTNAQGQTDPSSPVFSNNGDMTIEGSLNVDGGGMVHWGTSSNTDLDYNSNVFNGLYTYGTSSAIKPSFREISTDTP